MDSRFKWVVIAVETQTAVVFGPFASYEAAESFIKNNPHYKCRVTCLYKPA